MNNDENRVNEHLLGPQVCNETGDTFLFNLNRHVFDKVSASALFDATFGDALFKENTLNIIVGTDSGLLLHYLQNRLLPKGTRYIFIEPEIVLQSLQDYRLLGEPNDRIVCISFEGWTQAVTDFKISEYLYIGAVRSFNAICAQDDFINEYAELSWTIVEVLSQLHWQNNMEIGQEAFIDRQIKNVAENRLPAKMLQNAFHGQTAVILAGGPSLDDALPWVKLNRDKFVVFAVSRIARQLLAAEIEPDFVVSVDPYDVSFDVSKEMLNFGRKAVFIASYHVVSTLVNQWAGLMLYLGPRLPWDSTLNVDNTSGEGPTVTNTAVNVAHAFGFTRVILAGVDLCYTCDGFTHAKGSNEQLAGPKLDLTLLQVETNAGLMAPTGNDFLEAIKSLSLQVRRLVADGAQVINISPGAAKIDFVDFVPHDEVRLAESGLDVSAVVEARVRNRAGADQCLQAALNELKRAQFQIRAIARLAAEARSINDAMYNTSGVLENYKDKKQLDQIEKKFKREHRHFAKLVKRFGIRRFMQVMRPFNDEDWTAEEAKQLGNVYYDAYQEGASKLLQVIEESIERIIVRQQENSVEPNFDRIFEQWRKDKSFARASIWRTAHPDFKLPSEVSAVFDEFKNNFDQILEHQETRHFIQMKMHSNLGIARQRAGLLFKHKKGNELRDLLASLEKHEQQQAAAPYRYLVEGYLAELESKPEDALVAYHKIIDGGDVLLEDALIRIAGITIEHDQADNTNLALECLSQVNPVYLPLYAEMRRLQGDALTAIDVYSSYIGQFPQDTLVQMKLARLYMECNVPDGAEMMLDYILQQKPDYEAAMSMKRQLAVSRLSH